MEEVVTQPFTLAFVEAKTMKEILLSLIKNFDFHLARRLILRLASAQSVNRDLPC